MDSKKIEKALYSKYIDYIYKLNNSFIFNWESDFFAVSKSSGYFYEIEIKISRSDFKADFTKQDKHLLLSTYKKGIITVRDKYGDIHEPVKLENGKYKVDNRNILIRELKASGIAYKYPNKNIPNRFYYACPTGLITKEEVPEYAGLLYADEYGSIREVKKAPLLHKNNLFLQKKSRLLEKFYWLSVNQKSTILELKRTEEYLREKVKELEESIKKQEGGN